MTSKFINPDEARPHGRNPAIFDGDCDCDDCQLWDVMQRQYDKPRLPAKVIQGLSVRDYAYQWILGACPLHQWCSGGRGIDREVIEYVRSLWKRVVLDNPNYDAEDNAGLQSLLDYLEAYEGASAESYIPDEHLKVTP